MGIWGSRRGRFIGRKGQKECGISIEMLDGKRHDVGLKQEGWLVLVEDTCRRATTALEPWPPLLATLTSSVKRAGEAQDGKMRRCEKAFPQDLRKGQRHRLIGHLMAFSSRPITTPRSPEDVAPKQQPQPAPAHSSQRCRGKRRLETPRPAVLPA